MNYLVKNKNTNEEISFWCSADLEMVKYVSKLNIKKIQNVKKELTRFGYKISEEKGIKKFKHTILI